jgi:pseudouridine-5'-monophosphatase
VTVISLTQNSPLIFDLDGTLLDTEPLYSIAAQKVLDEFGKVYTQALKRRVMGGDSHTSARIVVESCELPLTPEEYLAKREVHLRKLFAECPEIPGAGEFIERSKVENFRVALATSSHKHLRDIKLGTKRWAGHFEVEICGDHPELHHGKPAPDIYLLCADALGVAAADCVAFEDSHNGVSAAKAAGMTVVAINSEHVEEADLADADYLIEDFREALDWL